MSEPAEKLTKKQRKALEFRNKSKSKDTKTNETEDSDKKRKRDEEVTKVEPEQSEEGQKKKRKTRRGKKGKGQCGSSPRFLLFVGNLPYDISETELMAHFAASKPNKIRIRTEKGIAFLEFDGAEGEIQHRIEVALRMHRSILRQRKINVELTVGGGGNSKDRLEKIRNKNDDLETRRRERISNERKAEKEKTKSQAEANSKLSKEEIGNVHPSRLGLIDR
ncbi:hypothetical protein WICMUC_002245 [Wickerhamomyces mucosus]|uniref:RRM domain-containing protein n=1 Tax=Wickerhamomyces mucosus TaxID=1378264 RepID=A0A9P8TEL1_9ASCO|nr:hypothetical protein WICMUC_002245 [Wickerhamomyces mucosus]